MARKLVPNLSQRLDDYLAGRLDNPKLDRVGPHELACGWDIKNEQIRAIKEAKGLVAKIRRHSN